MGGRQDGDKQQDHLIRLDHRITNAKIKSLPKRLDNWGTYTVGLEGTLQRTRQGFGVCEECWCGLSMP